MLKSKQTVFKTLVFSLTVFILTVFLVLLSPNFSSAASIITGAGPGGGPHVRSFDELGDVEEEPDKLMAYADSYRGGVRIAAGDIDDDGEDEIITGTGENGGPHLRVFEKDGTQRGIEFFPFDENFRGGMDVASGDFNDDGKEDIAVSQFSSGQAWVKVYKYNNQRTLLFEKNVFGIPECGATVAMGQLDSDEASELIVGAGNGCESQVLTFDYNASSLEGTRKPISIYAFTGGVDDPIRSGVDVAAGDVDGDGKDEIAVSRLKDDYPWVKIFRYNNDQTELGSFEAYGDYTIGVNVELHDIDSDGNAEVITGAGPTGGPQVRAFEYNGTAIDTFSFFAYDENFRGGVDVAGFSEEEEEDYISSWIVNNEKVITEPNFFDASVVQLNNGRYRMYGELHGAIKSYISDNGLDWQAEEGTRIADAAFPFVMRVNNQWQMFYVPSGGGLEQNQILSAISSDGLNFTQENGVRYTAGNECDTLQGPRIIETSNGSYRLYYTGISGSGNNERSNIFSALSSNSFDFTRENGMRINSTESPLIGSRAAHAFPFENSEGNIELYFAGATSNGGGILSATSSNGLDFTINPYPEIEELDNGVSPQDPFIIDAGTELRMYYGLYRGPEVVSESGIYIATNSN